MVIDDVEKRDLLIFLQLCFSEESIVVVRL